MIIKRSIESDGNIKPEVYNLLNNLPEEVLHHKSYGLLHPLGIYNRSLSRITDAFSDVLTEIKRFKKDIGPIGVHSKEHVSFESLNLLKAQKELLYSFQSHIDDCYHILKVTSPYPNMDKINSKNKKSGKRSPNQWLYHSKHPTVSFFQKNIQHYKSFIDLTVNKLKHEHARLRDIILVNEFEMRMGYFVETSGVDEEEVFVGPDPVIHPKGDVFSYSRDLSFHFYNLYEVSHHLKNAIIGSAKKQGNLSLKDNSYLKENSRELNEIVESICKLNLRFFPKEYLKPIPVVEWDQDTLFLSLDEHFRLNSDFFGVIRKLVSFTPDGTTKTFRFPIG